MCKSTALCICSCFIFFFKQKTAYELRISDWSSDVCSSDLIKVDNADPLAAVSAVRRAAPSAKLVVDANQAWTVDELKKFMPTLVKLGVDLLEQPVKVGFDDGLQDYQSPIPICADESINPAEIGRAHV